MNQPKINLMTKTVERNYRISVAAIKVYEANQSYEEAQKQRDEATYYPFTGDHEEYLAHEEENRRFFATVDSLRKAEAKLKKAVNNFFKACDEPVRKFRYAMDAQRQFEVYIKDSELFHCKTEILWDFSLLQCIE